MATIRRIMAAEYSAPPAFGVVGHIEEEERGARHARQRKSGSGIADVLPATVGRVEIDPRLGCLGREAVDRVVALREARVGGRARRWHGVAGAVRDGGLAPAALVVGNDAERIRLEKDDGLRVADAGSKRIDPRRVGRGVQRATDGILGAVTAGNDAQRGEGFFGLCSMTDACIRRGVYPITIACSSGTATVRTVVHGLVGCKRCPCPAYCCDCYHSPSWLRVRTR